MKKEYCLRIIIVLITIIIGCKLDQPLYMDEDHEIQGDQFPYKVISSRTITFREVVGPSIYVARLLNHDLFRIRLGDFDGDGKTDILRLNGINSGDTSILYADLGGFYPSPGPYLYVRRLSDHDLFRVKVGDFDGNGKSDILRLNGNNSGSTTIFYSRDDGFTGERGPDLYVANNLTHDLLRVKIGDFNGDGRSDILRLDGINSGNTTIYFSHNGFRPMIGPPDLYVAQLLDHDLFRVNLGDFNGNNNTDILRLDGINSYNTTIRIITWGGFEAHEGPFLYVAAALNHDLFRVKLGDFDGDGTTDILRLDGINSANTTIQYGGMENYSLIAGPGLYVARLLDHDLFRVHTGDFDGDNKTDILRLDGIDNGRTTILYAE